MSFTPDRPVALRSGAYGRREPALSLGAGWPASVSQRHWCRKHSGKACLGLGWPGDAFRRLLFTAACCTRHGRPPAATDTLFLSPYTCWQGLPAFVVPQTGFVWRGFVCFGGIDARGDRLDAFLPALLSAVATTAPQPRQPSTVARATARPTAATSSVGRNRPAP